MRKAQRMRLEEIAAREVAMAERRKTLPPKSRIPREAMNGFEAMTRHQVSTYMARERMRAEAEAIRGNTKRWEDAKTNQMRAKLALAYIDQQAGQ